MTQTQGFSPRVAVPAYALIWAASTAYLYTAGADWTFPFVSLAVFGLGLGGLAWFLTRGADVPTTSVPRPGFETMAIFGYLILYAFLFLGFGLSWLKTEIEPGRERDLAVLAAKLVAHVGLPVLLILALRAPLKPLMDHTIRRRRFWRTFLVLAGILLGLQAAVSPSLKNIADTGIGTGALLWVAPATYLWLILEVGVTEEFLFRSVLQTRLSALFRSHISGILVTSVLFALVHAPGLYLRAGPDAYGSSTDPLQVAAYTIAVLSPISLLFGVLWARTRSFLLIVLLHAVVDWLPIMSEFIHTWAL
ncbi:MAG: CPBP family intramembrane metalloprotease [Alphaproteobacteria bacterium]|nr:MAG: CPBP family intramembrane metalloprotease [Alphaproteobacteria bacterium]